jgi:Asp-tRNA(Asn)/Glu-tRNA(Gln) amidotransferase A subunit family amidase
MDLCLSPYSRRPLETSHRNPPSAFAIHQSVFNRNATDPSSGAGRAQEYFPASLDSSIISRFRRVVRALKNRGATVLPVSLPNTIYALSAYYVIASAEASSNLARYDGVQYGLHVPLPPGFVARSPGEVYAHSRTAGFGAEVKRRILLGTYALSAEYVSFSISSFVAFNHASF